MENFVLSDLNTKEPITVEYSSPTFVLFFSIKEIFLTKELNKDLMNTVLTSLGIYIGEDPKKVYL